MKIAFTLDQTTLLHTTTPSPPWRKPTIIPFLSPTTTMKNPYLPPRTWRIPAEARGGSNLKKSGSRKPKLRKVKEPEFEERKVEELVDDEMPDVVKGTLITRILVCVVVPLAVGLVLLRVLSILKEGGIWDFPRWVPFLTIFITFGSSILGIAYGALSTSWDAANNEGSVLGFEEAQRNWVKMWNDVDD